MKIMGGAALVCILATGSWAAAQTPWHAAAEAGAQNALGTFRESRSQTRGRGDVNGFDGNGHTPLHLAAASCQAKAVSLLISKGAAVDTKHPLNGERALTYALRSAQSDRACDEVAVSLLKAGANPNGVDSDGRPALVMALRTRARVLEAALDAGADVGSLNSSESGWPSLCYDPHQSAEDLKMIAVLAKRGVRCSN